MCESVQTNECLILCIIYTHGNYGIVYISLTLPIYFAGNMLSFMVDSKQAFEVSLADVAQTQMQGKNDVLLEFHVDDTTGANEVVIHTEHMNKF